MSLNFYQQEIDLKLIHLSQKPRLVNNANYSWAQFVAGQKSWKDLLRSMSISLQFRSRNDMPVGIQLIASCIPFRHFDMNTQFTLRSYALYNNRPTLMFEALFYFEHPMLLFHIVAVTRILSILVHKTHHSLSPLIFLRFGNQSIMHHQQSREKLWNWSKTLCHGGPQHTFHMMLVCIGPITSEIDETRKETGRVVDIRHHFCRILLSVHIRSSVMCHNSMSYWFTVT